MTKEPYFEGQYRIYLERSTNSPFLGPLESIYKKGTLKDLIKDLAELLEKEKTEKEYWVREIHFNQYNHPLGKKEK